MTSCKDFNHKWFIYKIVKNKLIYPVTKSIPKQIEKYFTKSFSVFKPNLEKKCMNYNIYISRRSDENLAKQSNRVGTKLGGGKWVGGAIDIAHS